MGMSVGGDSKGPKSDINVTPLVDVVLVLLIIFMVAMPIMMRHITIEVPRKVDDESKVVVASKPVTVTISRDGLTLNDGTNDKQITRAELASEIRPMIEKLTGEKVVFVSIGDEILYSEVIQLMDTIRQVMPPDPEYPNDPNKVDGKFALKTRDGEIPAN